MRKVLFVLGAFLSATTVRAQEIPIEVGIRAAEALLATAVAGRDPGPKPTRTPKPGRESETPLVQPDGSSVEAIITGLYACVSHGPEYEPNWDRMRRMFLRTGMLIPPKPPEENLITALDVEGFADRVRKSIAARKEKGERLGFYEREIARREHCFSDLCQVLSTYESRHGPRDSQAFARGVNSIQLVRDGRRWWIASIAWDAEIEVPTVIKEKTHA